MTQIREVRDLEHCKIRRLHCKVEKEGSSVMAEQLRWLFRSVLLLTFLLSYFRFLVLTTSGGIMDHEEARRKHLGGKILGFFF